MSPAEVGLLGFVLMMVLVLLGVNVSFAIIMVGFMGLAMIIGVEPALSSLAILGFERFNLDITEL